MKKRMLWTLYCMLTIIKNKNMCICAYKPVHAFIVWNDTGETVLSLWRGEKGDGEAEVKKDLFFTVSNKRSKVISGWNKIISSQGKTGDVPLAVYTGSAPRSVVDPQTPSSLSCHPEFWPLRLGAKGASCFSHGKGRRVLASFLRRVSLYVAHK